AAAEADHDVVDAAHAHAALRLTADEPEELLERPLPFVLPLFELVGRNELRDHVVRRQHAVPDRRDQRLVVLVAELLRGRRELAAAAKLRELQSIAAQVTLEQLGADLDAAPALLRLDPAPDALLRAARLDELQPVLARRLPRGGDDLDRVTALQLVLQRDELAVHARAGAVLADLRVDAVREVDDRRALREVEEVALRREREHLLGEEVLLHRAHELLRVLEMLLPFEDLPEPGEALDLLRRVRLVLALVAPVR